MLEFFFKSCTSSGNNQEGVSQTNQREMVEISEDILDKNKQRVLNSYNQGHILSQYSTLQTKEQETLLRQLELIQFDVLDLLFHNLVKKNFDKDIDIRFSGLDGIDFLKIDPNSREEKGLKGMQLISEGKVAVMITAGLSNKYGHTEPKPLIKPDWELNSTVFHFFLERLRQVGNRAVKQWGTQFKSKRQPILLYLMVNSLEMEEVDRYLASHNFFGYPGIITFGQDVLPYINEQGKMVLQGQRQDQLRLVSNGSGGILTGMRTHGLLAHVENAGVQVLQVVNLNNLALALADPALVCEALSSELIIDVQRRQEGKQSDLPVLLKNDDDKLEFLNQRQVSTLKQKNAKFDSLIQYQLNYLNVYINVGFLKAANKQNSNDSLYKYRIKEMINAKGATPSDEDLETSREGNEKIYYSFEIPIFNLLQMSDSPKLHINESFSQHTLLSYILNKGNGDGRMDQFYSELRTDIKRRSKGNNESLESLTNTTLMELFIGVEGEQDAGKVKGEIEALEKKQSLISNHE
jgi:UDP-N-acetylglucosamine/UDP-N-acetylgalactosamine diphosphorylase